MAVHKRLLPGLKPEALCHSLLFAAQLCVAYLPAIPLTCSRTCMLAAVLLLCMDWILRLLGLGFAVPGTYFLARGFINGALGRRLGVLFLMGGAQGLVGWWMVRSGLKVGGLVLQMPRYRRQAAGAKLQVPGSHVCHGVCLRTSRSFCSSLGCMTRHAHVRIDSGRLQIIS
jgi:hypothetical protein